MICRPARISKNMCTKWGRTRMSALGRIRHNRVVSMGLSKPTEGQQAIKDGKGCDWTGCAATPKWAGCLRAEGRNIRNSPFNTGHHFRFQKAAGVFLGDLDG